MFIHNRLSDAKHVRHLGHTEGWRFLCAKAGEGARISDVGARLGTTAASTTTGVTTSTSLTTTSTSAELATALAATTSLTGSTSTSLAATELATAAAASSATALTGRGSKHTVAVELNVDLLLARTFALGLALTTSNEIFLLVAGEGGTLGELLGATLVGLANVLGGKRKLLLGQLSKVGSVGLALVLRLSLGLGLSIFPDGVLLFGLSNSLASLLISQFSVTVLSAPAMSSLLVVLADAGPAVTVTLTTGTTTASSSTAATTALATARGTSGLTRSPSTVLVRSYAAIPESVLVGVVGLLGTVLVALPLGDGLGEVGSIALAMPHDGLVNCPCWRVGRPVGVELRVVAQ